MNKPVDLKEIHIASDEFGEVNFIIGDLDMKHWAHYAQAAARALPNLKRGMTTVHT